MHQFLTIRLSLWLRINYYRRLSRLPMTYIERKGVGEHMSRMIHDLMGLETIMCRILPNTIFEVYRFCLSLFFLYILDINLIYIVLVWEVFYFFTAHWLGTIQRKLQFMSREAGALTYSRLQEGFNGVQTVKTFGHDRIEVSGFLHRTIMSVRVDVLSRLVGILQWTILRGWGFFPYFREFIIMSYLYINIVHGNMTYGTIFPVIAYLSMFQNPMERIIDLWQGIRTNLVWAERVLQVWDAKPAVVNARKTRPVKKFAGSVSVNNVTFDYENGYRALHGISFDVKPGSFVGIVGPSGSGKTTLLNLLIRLSDPTSGSIRVDDFDIREFDYAKYQNSIGLVLQETFLSKESLRWNLMLGNWNATDAEMIEAIERCRLGNWLRHLPYGLDSVLNEGTRLSVGEKQRLGVVRALLRKSNILVLDEPTSSLDLDTEKEVLEVINDVRKGKTTMMVTHRLNTITDADRIIVMDKGNIVETGSHNDLLASGGLYSSLVDMFKTSSMAG
jgi:ABC-type multidrug transport system fused ATPase/permease subunit